MDEQRALGALMKLSPVDSVEEQHDEHEQEEGLHESLRASVR